MDFLQLIDKMNFIPNPFRAWVLYGFLLGLALLAISSIFTAYFYVMRETISDIPAPAPAPAPENKIVFNGNVSVEIFINSGEFISESGVSIHYNLFVVPTGFYWSFGSSDEFLVFEPEENVSPNSTTKCLTKKTQVISRTELIAALAASKQISAILKQSDGAISFGLSSPYSRAETTSANQKLGMKRASKLSLILRDTYSKIGFGEQKVKHIEAVNLGHDDQNANTCKDSEDDVEGRTVLFATIEWEGKTEISLEDLVETIRENEAFLPFDPNDYDLFRSGLERQILQSPEH